MVQALIQEITSRREEWGTADIESIYFGGGTPSVLTASEIEVLIGSVNANYNMTRNPEITLEANPDDLEEEQLKAFKDAGINRLRYFHKGYRPPQGLFPPEWQNGSDSSI